MLRMRARVALHTGEAGSEVIARRPAADIHLRMKTRYE
jgi:hypothetical protein